MENLIFKKTLHRENLKLLAPDGTRLFDLRNDQWSEIEKARNNEKYDSKWLILNSVPPAFVTQTGLQMKIVEIKPKQTAVDKVHSVLKNNGSKNNPFFVLKVSLNRQELFLSAQQYVASKRPFNKPVNQWVMPQAWNYNDIGPHVTLDSSVVKSSGLRDGDIVNIELLPLKHWDGGASLWIGFGVKIPSLLQPCPYNHCHLSIAQYFL